MDKTTLENYLKSGDFKTDVIASTCASWSENGYSVELLPDGKWFNVPDNSIGNLYKSAGRIMGLDALDTDEMQEYIESGTGTQDDFLSAQFYLEEQEIAQSMRDALKGQ